MRALAETFEIGSGGGMPGPALVASALILLVVLLISPSMGAVMERAR